MRGGMPRRTARNAYVLNLTSQQVGAVVGASALLLLLAFLFGYVVGQARGRAAAGAPAEPEAETASEEASATEVAPEEAAEPATEAAAEAPPAAAPAPERRAATAAAPARSAAARTEAPRGALKRYSIVAVSLPLGESGAAVARAQASARRAVSSLWSKGFVSARSETVETGGGRRQIRVVARDITTADRAVLQRNLEKVRAAGFRDAWPWTR